MQIAIGSDHAGFDLKEDIVRLLKSLNIDCLDCGTSNRDSVDYPDFGGKVSGLVSEGKVERGILICGTGIGMSIVANKFPNVRASLCNELFTAKMSRMHNDANILVIGGRIVGKDLALEIVRTWFAASFEGNRHLMRINKIKNIEENLNINGTRKS
jgi:ribose 5-phosphate isomerase B